MSQDVILNVERLWVAHGGIAAVRDVSLSVAPGEMVALIGPNGAGKTTLLNALSGVLRPEKGRVVFDDVDITGWRAHRVARRGLLQVPEGRRILGALSVDENLVLGSLALGARGKATREDASRVSELFPLLEQRRKQVAGTLSGGQQQMLAIGRALMGRPRLLLLDEPSLGLAPKVVEEVFSALERLRTLGLTILLVEQNARRALASADRAYVMESGRIVHQGSASQLASDPRIEAHYLGRRDHTAATRDSVHGNDFAP
jgi:branched-chain amino acid transport system ATP-binding protein